VATVANPATEGEEKGTVLPSLPPSKLYDWTNSLKPSYITNALPTPYHFSTHLKQLSYPEDGGSTLY